MSDEGRVRATRICLACRTVLLADERCTCGADSVAPASPAGWLSLVKAVWGDELPPPPSGRPGWWSAFTDGRAWFSAQMSAVIALTLVGITLFFSLCNDDPGRAVTSGRTWLFALALWPPVSVLIAWEIFATRRRGTRPLPRASSANGARPNGARLPDSQEAGLSGRVLGGPSLTPPVQGGSCVAWGIWIVLDDHTCLLRDARCTSFTLELDDGRRVKIDPGRIILDNVGPATRSPITAVDRFLLEVRVRPPPPLHSLERPDPRDPFAGDAVRQIVIRAGDRLELIGEVIREPVAGPTSSYREPAPAELTVEGVPRFRVVRVLA